MLAPAFFRSISEGVESKEESLSIRSSPCILGVHAIGGGFRLCAPRSTKNHGADKARTPRH